MPSPEHEAYRRSILMWCSEHCEDPSIEDELQQHAEAALVLWHMDLEPARPVLQSCYAPDPRGSRPRDPVVMLRALVLALLVGQPAINKWAPQLRGGRVLRLLAGLEEDDGCPGVGTLYDFLHRLHDGPIRRACEHQERPSVTERRRSRAPQPKRSKKSAQEKRKAKGPRKKRKRAKGQPAEEAAARQAATKSATAKLVDELAAARDAANPIDLLARLGEILLKVAVVPSAERGLLGDMQALLMGGDGSPLRTGASRYGKKTCDHPRSERCDCPRIYDDPDAVVGWDSHRKAFFYGHHFYEFSISSNGHDLPVALRLDPANASDHVASLKSLDWFRKLLAEHGLPWKFHAIIQDAGHDGEPNHRYIIDMGALPVIPLSTKAPAVHPVRPDVSLSPRGVPLCEHGAEMAPWGSAGPDRRVFVCPVKAGTLKRCPAAPDHQPGWVCRPGQRLAPTISVKVSDNPRLCPPLPRNRPRFQKLMNLRSGTERSNSMKKVRFKLEAARHRRHSFWLIRLHLIAMLQHGLAWVAEVDAKQFVAGLLGKRSMELAA